jgi:hypothetical protein
MHSLNGTRISLAVFYSQTMKWIAYAIWLTRNMIGFMQEQSTTIPSAIDLMFIAHNLERIADHGTNIAEDVLFLVKGIDVRHHAEVRE